MSDWLKIIVVGCHRIARSHVLDGDMSDISLAIERLQPKLLAVAYRMLGTVTDAEDAVQDAYLRFHQHAGDIGNSESWLVKVTTRLCIDRLRKVRREEYVGPWLPEPVPETWAGAGTDRVELAESLSMAFLVLLETLTPAERAAYLLREVFGYEYDEIADLLGKSPVNVRQITARAKKRLDQNDRRFTPAAGQADALAGRFFAACQSGDVHAIEAMLASDVVLLADGGGKAFAARRPISGSRKVANLLAVVFRKLPQVGDLTLATVNGRLGVVIAVGGRVEQVVTFASDGTQIDTLYAILNPDKLDRWPTSVRSEDAGTIRECAFYTRQANGIRVGYGGPETKAPGRQWTPPFGFPTSASS